MQTMIDEPKTEKRTDLEQVALEAASLGETTAAKESLVPRRILIVPSGEIRTTSSTFLVDDQAMAATVEAFEAHGTDLPIDYEHQTLGGSYSSPSGQAPAAGWITALFHVPATSQMKDAAGRPLSQGLWAEVSWTQEARRKLAARQYRYISPVALIRRSDRRLVGIHSVALTNKPAIVGMTPVVNRETGPEKTHRVVACIGQQCGTMMSALREVLALDESADHSVVLATCVQRIQSLQADKAEQQACDRVAAAMTAGKLTVAQRDWAIELAQRDAAEFDRWEAAAPQIVPLGRTVPPGEQIIAGNSGHKAIETAAREEWRCHRSFLEKLCTQEAYVANALRETGQ